MQRGERWVTSPVQHSSHSPVAAESAATPLSHASLSSITQLGLASKFRLLRRVASVSCCATAVLIRVRRPQWSVCGPPSFTGSQPRPTGVDQRVISRSLLPCVACCVRVHPSVRAAKRRTGLSERSGAESDAGHSGADRTLAERGPGHRGRERKEGNGSSCRWEGTERRRRALTAQAETPRAKRAGALSQQGAMGGARVSDYSRNVAPIDLMRCRWVEDKSWLRVFSTRERPKFARGSRGRMALRHAIEVRNQSTHCRKA